jgi:hypothetical protein
MQDSSEDLPKPPRRAARPFVSPREGVTGPFELSRRRSAQLFTPPGSSPATPPADAKPAAEVEAAAPPPASSAADGATEMLASSSLVDATSAASESDTDFEGDWTAPPMITPERTLDADSLLDAQSERDEERLVVEQYEHEEIELTAAASNYTDEHSIEVIAYDDANSLLQAAAQDGKHPRVDGLQLETTEFSFEQEPPPPRMTVDSFWATEPFAAVEQSPEAVDAASADVTEATIDADTAGEPPLVADVAAGAPAIDEQPLEWVDDPSTTISHAQAALEPEPEHDPEPPREAAPMFADIAPPWVNRLTPVSSQALEELKEAEPWDLTPAYGLEAIPEPAEASAPHEEPAMSAPAAEPLSEEAPRAAEGIADALARIAARVRNGELDVPAEVDMSDEAALSAVLTALLRARR